MGFANLMGRNALSRISSPVRCLHHLTGRHLARRACVTARARRVVVFNHSFAQVRAGLRGRESFLPGNGAFNYFTVGPGMKLSLLGL
jgi:hypothetical protein